MADRPDKVKERWVCIGRRRGSTDRSLFQFWAVLNEDGSTGAETAVKKGLVRGARPGAIYEVTVIDDGASMAMRGEDAPRYLGILEDTERVMKWRAEEKGAEAAERVDRKTRNEIKVDELRAALEPIRQACLRTDRVGKLAIKALVLEYLDRR